MLRPERALRAADVLAWLERAIKEHGAPAFLRSDNGPEFIAKEVQRWLADNGIKTIYIDPGSRVRARWHRRAHPPARTLPRMSHPFPPPDSTCRSLTG